MQKLRFWWKRKIEQEKNRWVYWVLVGAIVAIVINANANYMSKECEIKASEFDKQISLYFTYYFTYYQENIINQEDEILERITAFQDNSILEKKRALALESNASLSQVAINCFFFGLMFIFFDRSIKKREAKKWKQAINTSILASLFVGIIFLLLSLLQCVSVLLLYL